MQGEPSFGGEPADLSNFSLTGRAARFGDLELDFGSRELRRDGRAVAIPPQPLFLLMLLVSRAGHVVDRNTIQDCLWGEHPPSDVDRSLNHVIRKLRALLRDDARDAAMIRTVHRRGYRFVHPVEWVPKAEATRLEPPAQPLFFGTPATVPSRPQPGVDKAFFCYPASYRGQEPTLELTLAHLTESADDSAWPPLAEGAREELLTLLVGLSGSLGLRVIDGSGERDAPPASGESSHPNVLRLELRGSIRRVAQRARCHLRLISIADRALVAAVVFELEITGVFPLQGRIAELAVERLIRPMHGITTKLKPTTESG